MTGIYPILLSLIFSGCGNSADETKQITNLATVNETEIVSGAAGSRHFAGAFSNGMKGDSIFFDISADGKKLENLTFKGYWRCSGKLEQTTVGPEGAYTIVGGKVNDHISEPPDGGSTAWRFDLQAVLQSTTASGTFRMNINNLGCDTYLLKWTAAVQK